MSFNEVFWENGWRATSMRGYQKAFVLVAAGLVAAYGCAAEKASDGTAAKKQSGEDVASQRIVEGNNRFALDLYAKLRGRQGNLFLSPYSISTALAMTYAGARGSTASQMAEVLHFRVATDAKTQQPPTAMDRERFASMFGRVIKDLNARGRKGSYTLTVANALWGQKGYGFLGQFLKSVRMNYDGWLNEVDFVAATEKARKTINAWVEKQTNDKIKDLIPPGVLDPMTRLVLTNAIYFKGNWARQFKADQTKDAPFTLADGSKIQTPMMNQQAEFGYMETDSFQGLELPYANDELSMIILLPKTVDGLGELEKTLTVENLSQWLSRLFPREVIVSAPKFKATSQFSLASVLGAMGMKDAFTPAADFSGMDGKRDLFISAVIHKAYVDINEEGTEAAAATGVTMRLTSIGPSRIPVFRADHPFVFLIRDNHSGSILFIGRLTNPKQ
jgi:serine protease inhibitor